MSLEELEADLAANTAQVNALGALTTTTDLVGFIKNTLWPFQQNLVGELSAMDGAMQDIVDGHEDILQEETAGLFAAVIAGANGLIAILEKRLKLPEDTKLVKAIREWKKIAAEAGATIEEITVAAEPDDDEDDLEPEPGDETADPDNAPDEKEP